MGWGRRDITALVLGNGQSGCPKTKELIDKVHLKNLELFNANVGILIGFVNHGSQLKNTQNYQVFNWFTVVVAHARRT